MKRPRQVCCSVDFDRRVLLQRIMPFYRRALRAAGALAQHDDAVMTLLHEIFVEDIIRVQEQVVADIQHRVRTAYPGASYIEVTPASKARALKLRSRRELFDRLGLSLEDIERDMLHGALDLDPILRDRRAAAAVAAIVDDHELTPSELRSKQIGSGLDMSADGAEPASASGGESAPAGAAAGTVSEVGRADISATAMGAPGIEPAILTSDASASGAEAARDLRRIIHAGGTDAPPPSQPGSA